MELLSGEEYETALKYLKESARHAKEATCQRAKGGSVIVKNNEVIGNGFNSPPANLETQRRCSHDKNKLHRKVTDKTCCIHAEQRAIFDALKNNPTKLAGSTIYFTRIDENNKILASGNPYCTICSKSALDVGISFFILLNENGICKYSTEEYNKLSYEYLE